MKRSWSVLLLLAAACAAPPPPKPDVQMTPMPSEPGAFNVPDVSGEPETRRYKVRPEELLASSSRAVFDGRPSDGNMVIPPTDAIEDLTLGALADAARVIRKFVAPESWEADARRAIYVEKEEIVVRHTPAVLAQVERLLETLKAHRKTLVRLRVRFLTIPTDGMRGIKHLPSLKEGLGGVIDRKEADALMPKSAHKRTLMTQVPNLTLYHGQTGVVSLGSRFPYIKSYKPIGPDYDANIDVVYTGMDLRVRAVANGPQSDRFLVDTAVEVQDLNSVTNILLADYLLQFPATVMSRTAGQFVLGPDQAAVLLAPQVRPVSGILGYLGSARPDLGRVTLVIVELDRVE